jgi:hypothetical protein
MLPAKNHYCAVTTSGRDNMNIVLVSTIPAANCRLSSGRSRSSYTKCDFFTKFECNKYGKMGLQLGPDKIFLMYRISLTMRT